MMAEKASTNVYLEAFTKSYARLICALPIDDLLPELISARVIPGNLKERMDVISVRRDKVKAMLDDMEGGLKAQIPDQFEQFIQVMERFSTDENHMVVGKLASEIRALIVSESQDGRVDPSSYASASLAEGYPLQDTVLSSQSETLSHLGYNASNSAQESETGGSQTEKLLWNVIEELSPEIHSLIDMDSLFPHLMKHITMNDEEYSMLSPECSTSHRRVANLLEVLRKKDAVVHKNFLQALREEKEHTGHEYLCKLFEQRVQT